MTRGEDLLSLLRQRIRREGPITFAAFMAAALYEPGLGRYCSPTPPMGPGGDYMTSPEVDPAFGRLVGRAVAEMEARLRSARPETASGPFTIVEMGPGRGLLCRDLIGGLSEEFPGLFERVRYVLVETSSRLEAEQRNLLSEAGLHDRISWSTWPEILSGGRMTGCILANEFLDALPVHLVEWREGRVREVFVRLGKDGSLEETLDDPSTESVARYFEELEVELREGQRAEVNLAALDWIGEAGRLLESGYAVVVDYGHDASELYSRRHHAGTLLGYRRHQVVVDPLEAPGEVDLTSHLDFTALARAGFRAGLDDCRRTSQRSFLVAMGLAEMIAALAGQSGAGGPERERLRRRFGLHALMSPSGMGETFKVLVFSKRVPLEGLHCLRNPFRPAVERAEDGV